jgi:hypothetical protein
MRRRDVSVILHARLELLIIVMHRGSTHEIFSSRAFANPIAGNLAQCRPIKRYFDGRSRGIQNGVTACLDQTSIRPGSIRALGISGAEASGRQSAFLWHWFSHLC